MRSSIQSWLAIFELWSFFMFCISFFLSFLFRLFLVFLFCSFLLRQCYSNYLIPFYYYSFLHCPFPLFSLN
ncbi:hypothetical protein N657DRAFT_228251 [Parathielavia appendiculata]|uniref:Uncharacterized protein n=1 Tax=Parathielavia appendiculata TaxID=2587402 RepID=A0AAN6U7C5_9PEZI|nr:hypothetical protein N657DRAFT_228251 [Parathielavia appendiculata]